MNTQYVTNRYKDTNRPNLSRLGMPDTPRYKSPLESLKQSCIEMKLMREGKLEPKRDWRTMFDEIEKELFEEDNNA